MAYVERSVGGGDTGGRGSSAQAIILTGFLIAIAVVVIAVLLNSLIFAQDLSTRDDGVDDRGILSFEENVEATADGVVHTLGHNDSGNVTQDDLFEPDDAEDNFDDSMDALEENATHHARGRMTVAELSDITVDRTVWSVGQMRDGGNAGLIENESSEEQFQVFKGDANDPMRSIELYLEIDFGALSPGNIGFKIAVLEDQLPPQAAVSQDGTLWELKVEGDEGLNVTQNQTGAGVSQRFISLPSGTDNITVELYPQDNDACLRVDGDDQCHPNSGDLMPSWLDDEDVQAINIDNDYKDWDGSYEIRMDSGPLDVGGTDNFSLCDRAPPCVSDTPNDLPLHEVGVVDDASYNYSYVSRDVEHVREVEGIKANQSDFKVDGVETP